MFISFIRSFLPAGMLYALKKNRFYKTTKVIVKITFRLKDSIQHTDLRANPLAMNEIATQHTYYAHIGPQTLMEAVHEEINPGAKNLLLSVVVHTLQSGNVGLICNFINYRHL